MDPLAELGARIASLRRARDLARAELARRAGLSERFLADVESGRGNIAFSRLLDLCAALEAPLSLLASDLEPSGARGGTAALRQSILESLRRASRAELEEARRWLEQRELARRAVVALVGLRGAGKTTLGRRVAARLRARFVELDERVEVAWSGVGAVPKEISGGQLRDNQAAFGGHPLPLFNGRGQLLQRAVEAGLDL